MAEGKKLDPTKYGPKGKVTKEQAEKIRALLEKMKLHQELRVRGEKQEKKKKKKNPHY